jgi:hypothetical protein
VYGRCETIDMVWGFGTSTPFWTVAAPIMKMIAGG